MVLEKDGVDNLHRPSEKWSIGESQGVKEHPTQNEVLERDKV
jgi:hypothetical protein